MEEEYQEQADSLNTEEQDLVPDTEAELQKAKEIAQNQKIRAEKAEAQLKALKEAPKPIEKQNDMSLKDIRALQDVHDEDVDDILDYAKYKGISTAEAKKSPAMIALLKSKEEDRKTAQAANSGGGKRGTTQVSDERILEDFSRGKVSENDDDIARLADARFNQRKQRR